MVRSTITLISAVFILFILLGAPARAHADMIQTVRSMLDEYPGCAVPADGETASADTDRTSSWMAGGGIQIDISLAETDWNAGVGFGGLGMGLVTLDLLPGKPYPFPAVIAADVELIYFAAESGISDVHFTAHGTFGVDLLYKKKGIMLFPYVGIGIGLEIVSGSKRIGTITIDADDTRLILPWEIGCGLVYGLTDSISIFARAGLSFPINPANIYVFMRLQGGILFSI